MPNLRVRRTLVKSPPELWTELSEVEGLERHLGEFGEIKITRAEPETTVAWEGENASGTVELEPTGWGTKVTMTAEVVEPEAAPEPEPESPVPSPQSPGVTPEPEPVSVAVESVAVAPEPDPGPFDPDPDPFDPEPVPEPKRRGGLFARWLFRDRRGATPAQPEHNLSEFPVAPEPQLPEWNAQEPALEPDPGPVDEVLFEPEEEDFEFDFAVHRGDEQPEPEEPSCEPIAPERAREVLEAALENLGQAHHRPFSRG